MLTGASWLVANRRDNQLLAGDRHTGWPFQEHQGLYWVHAESADGAVQLWPPDALKLPSQLADVLQLPRPVEPVYVFLFDRKASYRAYLDRYFPDAPRRRALFIKSRGFPMVFAYAQKDLAIDVRHELTHALLQELVPLVPLWLDEGLAEYFELPPHDRSTANPQAPAVRMAARLGMLPGLEKLERLDQSQTMSSTDYRNCWAWTHFLIHGPETVQHLFRQYLSDVRLGRLEPPLSVRLAQVETNPRAALSLHFRRW